MDPWRIVDILGFGSHSLLIEGTLRLEEARNHIATLAQRVVVVVEQVPRLVVSLVGDHVEAVYQVAPAQAHPARGEFFRLWSALETARPVFRGRLSEGLDGARLAGWFGLDWVMRILGALSIVIVAFMSGAWLARFDVGYLAWAWAVPIIFFVVSWFCRQNGADDMRLIHKNLEYALRGDVQETDRS